MTLTASGQWLTVLLAEGAVEREALAALEAAGLEGAEVDVRQDRLRLVRVDGVADDALVEAVRRAERAPAIQSAIAGVHTPDGGALGLTGSVIAMGPAFPTPTGAVADAIAVMGARVTAALPQGDGALISLDAPTRENVLTLAAALRLIEGVTDAHPDFVRRIDRRLQLNDPYLPNQWYLGPIQATSAWDTTTGHPDVIVAVIDDGFDMNHEDYAAKIVDGAYDFGGNDDWPAAGGWDNHGTAVAGVAIAIGGNGKGVAGVCPACSFLPIKQGHTDWSIVNAFAHVGDVGAHVVNNSWGFYYPSSSVQNAITSLSTNGRGGLGTMVIFASGNEGQNIDAVQDISATPGAIAVSSANQWDQKSGYSNWGASIDIGAPADGQYTTDKTQGGYSNGKYTSSFGGTSGAAPVGAGAAGLIFSLDPTMTEAQAVDLLLGGADKVGGQYGPDGKNQSFGHGRLNAANSLALYDGPIAPPGDPGQDDPDPPTPDEPDQPAPPTGECANACGGQASSGCWCDAECADYGDCCADVCDSCGFDCDAPPEPDPPADPEPGDPGQDPDPGDNQGCAAFFDCANQCSSQWCLQDCQAQAGQAALTLASAVIDCLSTNGCYNAQSQAQFQQCANTHCQPELSACFEPAIEEPEPPEEPDPGSVQPQPNPTPPADEPTEPEPEDPEDPVIEPLPIDPTPENDAAATNPDQGFGHPTTLSARSPDQGCTAGSGGTPGLPAALVLLAVALLVRRRACRTA